MLTIVKTALRISGDAFDNELQLLIDACIEELKGLGVEVATGANGVPTSKQVQTAIIAYCKWQFGDNEHKTEFEAIYHTKLSQLKTMDGYTDWSV